MLWDINKSCPPENSRRMGGKLIQEYKEKHSAPATSFCFSNTNEKQAYSVGLDKKINLYDFNTKKVSTTNTLEQPLSFVSISNEGKYLYVSTLKNFIFVFDLKNFKKPLKTIDLQNSFCSSLFFHKKPPKSNFTFIHPSPSISPSSPSNFSAKKNSPKNVENFQNNVLDFNNDNSLFSPPHSSLHNKNNIGGNRNDVLSENQKISDLQNDSLLLHYKNENKTEKKLFGEDFDENEMKFQKNFKKIESFDQNIFSPLKSNDVHPVSIKTDHSTTPFSLPKSVSSYQHQKNENNFPLLFQNHDNVFSPLGSSYSPSNDIKANDRLSGSFKIFFFFTLFFIFFKNFFFNKMFQ